MHLIHKMCVFGGNVATSGNAGDASAALVSVIRYFFSAFASIFVGATLHDMTL